MTPCLFAPGAADVRRVRESRQRRKRPRYGRSCHARWRYGEHGAAPLRYSSALACAITRIDRDTPRAQRCSSSGGPARAPAGTAMMILRSPSARDRCSDRLLNFPAARRAQQCKDRAGYLATVDVDEIERQRSQDAGRRDGGSTKRDESSSNRCDDQSAYRQVDCRRRKRASEIWRAIGQRQLRPLCFPMKRCRGDKSIRRDDRDNHPQ